MDPRNATRKYLGTTRTAPDHLCGLLGSRETAKEDSFEAGVKTAYRGHERELKKPLRNSSKTPPGSLRRQREGGAVTKKQHTAGKTMLPKGRKHEELASRKLLVPQRTENSQRKCPESRAMQETNTAQGRLQRTPNPTRKTRRGENQNKPRRHFRGLLWWLRKSLRSLPGRCCRNCRHLPLPSAARP